MSEPSDALHPSTAKAAERGNPSFVWRAGQERRLAMLNAVAPLAGKRVLEFGCGIGLYMREIRRYTPHVFGFDIEIERLQTGRAAGGTGLLAAAAERLPFADNAFDVVFSNEVLEHVVDDRAACREMARVLRPGGRAVIFAPNRLYPFETHGIYWRGQYHFGNKLLVNWLPDVIRNALAPHVRAYTSRQLRALFDGAPVRLVLHTQVYPGFDNIVARAGLAGRALRAAAHRFESSPLRAFGLSHLLVVEKV
ncbi:MAG: class I SAM-dependent methyltransferase [Chloroflexi bacterium]|jgi:SAM-dependent methyltransferase|uniref:Class I SAM-dependent methyltransferase n=1 Tax=Candidatus Thermofonsia Clade 3 bacterium TaxID=2364212 RepID=A0A2M8QE08_9CHLR|nr:class I SAM-dependent methyltransferase [Candidatus Roseilinea sp. NK_OTU-006]PJF48039.1 MAG: class I SAM-dependent methyltransferase [Candidatus Thermofonsia Clade 3 bacterium]RMG63803.1 MAG: class I SAM-dependent methyltransferase [Chloroflexota bacterium]